MRKQKVDGPEATERTAAWVLRWQGVALSADLLADPANVAQRIGSLSREAARALPTDAEPAHFDALFRRLAKNADEHR
jgi:hypothetical protein